MRHTKGAGRTRSAPNQDRRGASAPQPAFLSRDSTSIARGRALNGFRTFLTPNALGVVRLRTKPVAWCGSNRLQNPCPNSHVPVAVCRSVGIRTRGRVAARGKSGSLFSSHRDRQPEAKPAQPDLIGRRGLKQRRSGLFWYCRRECRGHRRGLSIFAGRAERDLSLIRTKAAIECDARRVRAGVAGGSPFRRHCRRSGGAGGMTARIREFLKKRTDEGPCLVVDLDVVRDNYQAFAKTLPDTRVYYAIKANPAPEILRLLVELGSCFDVASLGETHAVLAAGATPDRISFGNTIKKESDIAAAFALGVTLSAVDCEAEVEKVARAAPGSRVICRIHCDGSGAEWPLSRKFGCEPAYAADILEHAHRLGLVAYGISFHVGSQQHNVEAWDRALASTAGVFRSCAERGLHLSMVNLGGGFPAKYIRKTPKLESYGRAIFRALRKHFGNAIPNTIIEPGRGLVGNAGLIEAEVVLIAKRSPEDEVRWVYLDIGKFHGLAETIDEALRYPIRTPRDRDQTAPCVIAGPTCDSVDVLYEKTPYPLPVSLAIGDKVLIEAAGAYTTSYSSVGFNGYPPLRQYVI